MGEAAAPFAGERAKRLEHPEQAVPSLPEERLRSWAQTALAAWPASQDPRPMSLGPVTHPRMQPIQQDERTPVERSAEFRQQRDGYQQELRSRKVPRMKGSVANLVLNSKSNPARRVQIQMDEDQSHSWPSRRSDRQTGMCERKSHLQRDPQPFLPFTQELAELDRVAGDSAKLQTCRDEEFGDRLHSECQTNNSRAVGQLQRDPQQALPPAPECDELTDLDLLVSELDELADLDRYASGVGSLRTEDGVQKAGFVKTQCFMSMPTDHGMCPDPACAHQNRQSAKFCEECGKKLLVAAVGSSALNKLDVETEGSEGELVQEEANSLTTIGFKIGEGVLRSSSAEWELLRESIQCQLNTAIKHIKHEVAIVDTCDVFFTQESCSDHFRRGGSLQNLVMDLKNKKYDPLQVEWLILNVVQARIRGGRREVYYALDHRRLKCMKDAGCTKVRVRIMLANNDALNQFVNKGMTRIGMHTDVRIKRQRRA